MNKKTLIITTLLTLITLITPITANVNYTEHYCQDNETLVTHKFYDNGTANITTQKQYEYTPYGCRGNKTIGGAIQPNGTFDGIKSFAAIFAVLIGTTLASIAVLKKDAHQGLKTGLFLFAFILATALTLTTSGMLTNYTTNPQIQSLGATLGTVGYATGMTTVLILAYFIIGIFFNLFDVIAEEKNKEPDNYNHMK